MNSPAEIRRQPKTGGWHDGADVIVARGPLVIMAHGLMALAPDARNQCWISCGDHDFSPQEAEEVLQRWSTPH